METTQKKETRGRKPKQPESTIVKGNKTDLLPENHPMKGYEFDTFKDSEKIMFNKGMDFGLADIFHVYVVPWKNRRTGSTDGEPHVLKFDPIVFKKRRKTWDSMQAPGPYDEITILHDPTVK